MTDAAFILFSFFPSLFLFNKSVFLGHLWSHLCFLQQGIGMHNEPKSQSLWVYPHRRVTAPIATSLLWSVPIGSISIGVTLWVLVWRIHDTWTPPLFRAWVAGVPREWNPGARLCKRSRRQRLTHRPHVSALLQAGKMDFEMREPHRSQCSPGVCGLVEGPRLGLGHSLGCP